MNSNYNQKLEQEESLQKRKEIPEGDLQKETTSQKRERLINERKARGEQTELKEITDTPQQFTTSVADMSKPIAPSVWKT